MRRLSFLLLSALLLASAFPIVVQAQSSPQVVHAVLFWIDGCPHCHEVLDNVLPPLQEKYGAQLEFLLVEVVGTDDVDRLYEVAAAYDIPREQVGVPFLIVGDHVLIGSLQIPEELPGLIDRYLAQGGVDWPEIPQLNAFLTQTTPTPQVAPTASGAVVQAILFTTLDCSSCQLVTAPTLGSLKERYGDRVKIQIVDVITSADVEYVYQVAEGYGFSREDVDLPLLIIGDQMLIDDEIPARLENLVEEFLQAGGINFPILPPRLDVTVTPVPVFVTIEPDAAAVVQSNGFTLAIVIMALMTAALIYSLVAFIVGKSFSLPPWADWLIPALIVTGVGVAGYLSYVETQSVAAICGPVGDCNTVQQSQYAKLFGILPIGVLGLLGYLGLLAAWLACRFVPKLERPAAIGFWGMAFFAVIFSLYLTYLEPFVIKAVCIWCLASAVIVTLLLLLGTPPTILQFVNSEEDE